MSRRKHKVFETASATYTDTDIIGEGGSGRVFKATDESGCEFAVKLLDPSRVNTERRKRFKNELRFGLRNQHSNIITVVDHGVFIDKEIHSPFYVMPFYDGSLRSLMKARIPTDQVLKCFSQLMDGVEAAHREGIFHRDLKPENILHDKAANKLLVADFGIAHFEQEELYTSVETAPGSHLANFQYAAPEQRNRDAQVDHRADIYSLGLMLNEMFTGEIPLGTNYKTIGSVAPQYSYLDDLVSEMLRQSPSERPASIDVIKQQLIGRKNEFISRQRISQLKQTVVPVTDIDDPLISDPPRLVNFDWRQGHLTLVFQQPVSSKWIREFQNQGDYARRQGVVPTRFRFSGNQASIDVRENKVQGIINSLKVCLQRVNKIYEQRIRADKEQEERQYRQQLQREIEEEELRQKVLRSIKL